MGTSTTGNEPSTSDLPDYNSIATTPVTTTATIPSDLKTPTQPAQQDGSDAFLVRLTNYDKSRHFLNKGILGECYDTVIIPTSTNLVQLTSLLRTRVLLKESNFKIIKHDYMPAIIFVSSSVQQDGKEVFGKMVHIIDEEGWQAARLLLSRRSEGAFLWFFCHLKETSHLDTTNREMMRKATKDARAREKAEKAAKRKEEGRKCMM